jgi:hypothetical protein
VTEEEITTTTEEEPKETIKAKRAGVGASLVPPVGIVLITAYLILASVLLLYVLVQFWPPPAPASGSAPASSPVAFLFWTFSVSDEARLIFIVAMAGALGSLVHALRSLYWYVGNRELVWSWLTMYVLLPFVGSTLGLVFYFVIRGGFFSPTATIEQTSPFGFVALSGLVGMFSEQAVLKLKEVAETLLAPTPEGEDHVAPKTGENSEDAEAKLPGEGQG